MLRLKYVSNLLGRHGRFSTLYSDSGDSDLCTGTIGGLAFFIGWIHRPRLKFTRHLIESQKMSANTVEYTILLEVQNIGKNPARNCHAEFDF